MRHDRMVRERGLACLLAARRAAQAEVFAAVRRHLQADIALLRETPTP